MVSAIILFLYKNIYIHVTYISSGVLWAHSEVIPGIPETLKFLRSIVIFISSFGIINTYNYY